LIEGGTFKVSVTQFMSKPKCPVEAVMRFCISPENIYTPPGLE
jgi:hypothetical protein